MSRLASHAHRGGDVVAGALSPVGGEDLLERRWRAATRARGYQLGPRAPACTTAADTAAWGLSTPIPGSERPSR